MFRRFFTFDPIRYLYKNNSFLNFILENSCYCNNFVYKISGTAKWIKLLYDTIYKLYWVFHGFIFLFNAWNFLCSLWFWKCKSLLIVLHLNLFVILDIGGTGKFVFFLCPCSVINLSLFNILVFRNFSEFFFSIKHNVHFRHK